MNIIYVYEYYIDPIVHICRSKYTYIYIYTYTYCIFLLLRCGLTLDVPAVHFFCGHSWPNRVGELDHVKQSSVG